MGLLIKNVRGCNIVEFDKGLFDSWCVYLTRSGQPRYAPRDTEYFSILQVMGDKYGQQKIYTDFVSFYTPASRNIDPDIIQLITNIADTYNDDEEEMDIWFSVIYAGMIAEENKAKAILKKRIKRLGMHQVLVEGLSPDLAASFSKGKKWKELDVIMKERGF